MPELIIITTGDELLYGTTVDTNSAFICSRFFGTEINVCKHITVDDSIDAIIHEVTGSIASADIVITTGGLGPTDDDNTVEAICRIFNRKQVVESGHSEKMKNFFSSMKMPLHESDTKMVSYPEGAVVLKNSKGLAPGFIIEQDNKIVISLPGVPSEMEEMFSSELTGYLRERFNLDATRRIVFKVTGIRESEINSLVRPVLSAFNVRWGITPKSGICDLIIVPESVEFSFSDKINSLIREVLGHNIIMDGFDSPEEELIHLLREKKLKLATAESCTGGLLAKRITDIPGSSDVFAGSIVAYSNELKISLLGVSADVILKHGAVSEETAALMVRGACRITGADVAVSITGIAGPGGGTAQKPVGTVCFGFSICGREFLVTRRIPGSRERVRIFSSLYAINFLRKELIF